MKNRDKRIEMLKSNGFVEVQPRYWKHIMTNSGLYDIYNLMNLDDHNFKSLITKKQSTDQVENKPNSWFFSKRCGACGHKVVVLSSVKQGEDYTWYCSNPSCKKHKKKTHTGDQEYPEWLAEEWEEIE